MKEVKPVIFGIDVEEWYQTMAFQDYTRQHDRGPALIPHYSLNGVRWVLDILEQTRSTATFFVNGELAREVPEIVSIISQRGYEIACHGYYHQSIHDFSEEQIRQELQDSVGALVGLSASHPKGYRAPNWSIIPENSRYFSLLSDEGFLYDASILPVKTPWFGTNCPLEREPYCDTNGIVRFYPSIVPFGPFRFPIGIGFLFRWLPYATMKRLINHPRTAWPAQINIHAWELASMNPLFYPNSSSRVLTGTALQKVRAKIIQLCTDFRVLGFNDWLTKTGASEI